MWLFHPIQMRWLAAKEGGRQTPFAGGRYAPTARFAGELEEFSVVMDFPASAAVNPTKGTLRLLNPELVEVQRRLAAGAALEILEGRRVVAHCKIKA